MNQQGKKFVILFLIFSLLAINCATLKNLERKREKRKKHGALLIIQKVDGRQIRAELIAVKNNSLLLLDSENEAEVSADVDDIQAIKILKSSRIWAGAKIGGALGLLGGIIISLTHPKTIERLGYVSYAIVGGLIGVVLGGGVGALLEEETIKIEGMSSEAKRDVLKELRSKARIPNYR